MNIDLHNPVKQSSQGANLRFLQQAYRTIDHSKRGVA
jgi:hypothetical protein